MSQLSYLVIDWIKLEPAPKIKTNFAPSCKSQGNNNSNGSFTRVGFLLKYVAISLYNLFRHFPNHSWSSLQVFVLEDTALNSNFTEEIFQDYVVPTLEHFNDGPGRDQPWASVECTNSYSLVLFRSSDSVPG